MREAHAKGIKYIPAEDSYEIGKKKFAKPTSILIHIHGGGFISQSSGIH